MMVTQWYWYIPKKKKFQRIFHLRIFVKTINENKRQDKSKSVYFPTNIPSQNICKNYKWK